MPTNPPRSAPPSWSSRPGLALASLLALAWVVLVAVPPAGAWSYHTHRKIVSDALDLMPPLFRQRFAPDKAGKDRMMRAGTDPDTLLRDFHNHIYHVHGNERGGASRIWELFRQTAGRLRRHDADDQIAYDLGLISHYIADLCQPLHTDGSNVDPDEDRYHALFEKQVQQELSRLEPAPPSRWQPVTDPLDRVKALAEDANRFYGRIGQAYKGGNQIFDLRDIVDTQYARSVREVVEFWLGIMAEGGVAVGLPETTVATRTGSPATGPRGPAAGNGPDLGLASTAEGARREAGGDGLPIDLNQATRAELESVPGIGPKKAQAILDQRALQRFKSVYDLTKVKGFSPRSVERLADYLTVR